MTELTIIEKGIYSAGETDISRREADEKRAHGFQNMQGDGDVAVIVHPFFIYGPKYDCVYIRNIRHLIGAHEGPLFTLEEEHRLEETASRYENMGRTGHSYFAKTEKGKTILTETSYENISRFLRTFGGSEQPLKMAGGARWKEFGCLP